MDSNNPVFNDKTLNRILSRDVTGTDAMTVTGTINKTGLLFLLLVGAASLSWNMAGSPMGAPIAIGSMLVGFVLCLVMSFNQSRAPILAPIYAIAEGLAIGWISAMYDFGHPGLVFNAMVLTMGCLGLMLVLYRTGILAATERFTAVVVGATSAIALTYIIDMVLMMFGHPIHFIHEGGMFGIGFSVVVVGVAALNLILDFDLVEKSAARRAPKYMEWYAGFALMVTIVWVYLEILRLLSKLSRR
jgi:uncharacterized YccA/Bax inhibitor family protein